MIPSFPSHILSFAELGYFPLAPLHQFKNSTKIISALFDCTFSAVPSACSPSSPCQKHFLSPRHSWQWGGWVSCERFPWKQWRIPGSGKTDTVGCDGTHFTQSFDLIQSLKVLLDLQPSISTATTAQNTEFPDRPGVQWEFCASLWYRKLFGIQRNPRATITATNFSDRNLSGLEPVIASIELLPTTKNKQVNHNLLAFLTLFLN